MKKSIYIIIITALISSLLTVFGYWQINRLNEKKVDNNEDDKIVSSNIRNYEVTKINYDIPDFTMNIIGLKYTPIIKETIKGIDTYQISADISDSIYTRHYVYKGVKVKDVIAKATNNFTDYYKIIFMSTSGLRVEYLNIEIDDDLFFVFEKDGIKYPEGKNVTLLNPKAYDSYNIINVKTLNLE